MKIENCPICNNKQLKVFLERKDVPVHQNLLMHQYEAAKSIKKGELKFVTCEKCGFVFNQKFDFALLNYGENYDNTQSFSEHFESYLDDLVKKLVEEKGIKNCTILEIGCGKGHFLKKLVNYPEANNQGYGFDPSYVGPLSDLDGKLKFQKKYYDDTCHKIKADVIICRHVIEHIQEPLLILETLYKNLQPGSKTRIFFETPCVEWILKNQVIWDFFYEHCSLFTAQSLSTAFELKGFTVDSVEHIFGNQYLWLEAHLEQSNHIHFMHNIVDLCLEYAKSEQELIDNWSYRLNLESKGSKIALWGAGAKGATFANLCDPHATLFDCIVDVNPNKQNCYIPGTGHSIVAPEDLALRHVKKAVLMNPNYLDENIIILNKLNIELNFINWSK